MFGIEHIQFQFLKLSEGEITLPTWYLHDVLGEPSILSHKQ